MRDSINLNINIPDRQKSQEKTSHTLDNTPGISNNEVFTQLGSSRQSEKARVDTA